MAMVLLLSCCAPLSGCSTTNTRTAQVGALSTTLESVKQAIDQGHLEEAHVILKRVDCKQLSATESEQLLDSWLSLASSYQEMGKFAVAGPVLETALQMAKDLNNAKRQAEILLRLKTLAKQEKEESSLLESEITSSEKERHAAGRAFRSRAQKLQVKYLHTSNFKEAAEAIEPYLEEAKNLRKRSINEMQLVMQILEELYTRFKKYDRCVAMYEEHLKSLPASQLEGLDSGDFKSIENARDLIEDHAGIARMRIYQKRFQDAYDHARQAYELSKQIYGPGTVQFALRCHDLGNVVTNLGRPDEAIDLFKEEVDSYARKKERENTVRALCALGRAYQSSMRYREAKSTMLRVLAMMRREQAPDVYARTQSLLSIDLLKLNEIRRAEQLNREVLEALKQPDLHAELIQHLTEWQQACLFVPEKLPEVFSTGKRLVSESSRDGKSETVLNRIRNSQYYCAKAQLHSSRIDNAIAELNALLKGCPATEPYHRRLFYNDLAICYRFKGDLKKSEFYYRQPVEGTQEPASIASWQNALGWCLLDQGKTREAKVLFESMKIPECSLVASTMLVISKNAAMVILLKELGEEKRAEEILKGTIKTFDDFTAKYEGVDATGISLKLSQAAGKVNGYTQEQKRLAKLARAMCDRYLAKSPWHAKVLEYTQTLSKEEAGK